MLLSDHISVFPSSDTLTSYETSSYHTSAHYTLYFRQSSQYTLKPMQSCHFQYSPSAPNQYYHLPHSQVTTPRYHTLYTLICILLLNCDREKHFSQRLLLSIENIPLPALCSSQTTQLQATATTSHQPLYYIPYKLLMQPLLPNVSPSLPSPPPPLLLVLTFGSSHLQCLSNNLQHPLITHLCTSKQTKFLNVTLSLL